MASTRKPKGKSGAALAEPARIIGTGEMADLVRAFDWAQTSLGPAETWPDTLVTTVNLVLSSKHPMFLWWGPDLIQFYNDGYRPSIRADKHPSALGQRGPDCWPEIWHIIGPQIEAVMSRGESTWNLNQLVPINRNGKLEEVYWTYGYSPLRDKDGIVQGTLVVCSETTEQVLAERRLRTLLALEPDSSAQEQMEASGQLRPFAEFIVRKLQDAPSDIPFAILYLSDRDGVFQGVKTDATGPVSDARNWPLAEVLASQSAVVVDDLQQRFGNLVCPPCPEPVTRAYVMPLSISGAARQAAVVFGTSPRLPFEANYRTFLELVGARIESLFQAEVHTLELAEAARRFQSLVEADPFSMVIGDLRGGLQYVNPAFLKMLGYSEADVRSGAVRWDALTPPEYADADARAVEQLRTTGSCDLYEKIYIAKDGRRIPILLGASVIDNHQGEVEVAAFITNLTSLKTAEEALRKANDELEKKVAERTAELEAQVADRRRAESSLRELTGRLLRTQDEERRYMARELHDHAGQTLVALGFALHELQQSAAAADPKVAKLTSESKQLSDDLSKEIRTLSYLLHPPLLDEAGLTSAISWYVDGFAKRSKIAVDLELPEDLGRLPRELEIVIFRIIQESLTNIHRHSGSPSAKICLRRSESSVDFEISDRGVGIPEEILQRKKTARTGVGVRGMEERVRQFGGTLQVVSSPEGTTVIARMPLQSPDSESPE
jgi:PAS domain S-box-containing protein